MTKTALISRFYFAYLQGTKVLALFKICAIILSVSQISDCSPTYTKKGEIMYAAIPGKTGALAVRFETTAASAPKPAQKSAEPMLMAATSHYCEGYACSCKGFHDEFSRKDPYRCNMRSGKEHRKCQHSHFGRRGRRAIEIFH
jgi:hypothetical protein